MVSQANPVRIFVTHAWENSDDYLRVFEYLESSRTFFYRNYSTPEVRPQGDKEALRDNLRKQIAPAEAVIALASLGDTQKDLLMFQLLYAAGQPQAGGADEAVRRTQPSRPRRSWNSPTRWWSGTSARWWMRSAARRVTKTRRAGTRSNSSWTKSR